MTECKKTKKQHTLQSRAYFLASIMAAFLSLSVSNVNTNERPFLACQNIAFAALVISPLTPHSYTHRKIIKVLKWLVWDVQAIKACKKQ